jgi:glycosyltransferase involved in cell wall biosynthesis
MTLGVTISTYQRSDGQTPHLLLRAIQSIVNQSYQNFKIFIIGDKYEDNTEFEAIINSFIEIADKIVYENLHFAHERDKYLGINNTALWNCGGANALNHANNLAKVHGITKVCHLDHDDIWLPNHLELIAKAILEKNNPMLDCEVKMKFATHLYKEFRGWVGEAIRVHKMAEEYMKNFKYEK